MLDKQKAVELLVTNIAYGHVHFVTPPENKDEDFDYDDIEKTIRMLKEMMLKWVKLRDTESTSEKFVVATDSLFELLIEGRLYGVITGEFGHELELIHQLEQENKSAKEENKKLKDDNIKLVDQIVELSKTNMVKDSKGVM